uniref:Uncharacterized protein n=1 Tax=Spumella elongata TaxID=89044 RepID=A0A7S3MEL2_9STRA|mmetsp:Transcript_59294/g.104289  ORF Transcript_59294/g.104289 Transcript_59294/m.104289 type:complete len:249 (+) Transcript_59294:115-861(+)|eukprot:CAMPEP_0185009656 /NCGR_PEP_ID=MMETSP1098-20130426/92756_1 /TAXON_ID=89044 /ORGANISM="Spumella elongata, Strain CCAP 955/1" /LENGTH=248 /DNA_ID=CAMNT_0027538361 /DNA_START=115 /DNA_END=864 /DNA_ORIENTATION=+
MSFANKVFVVTGANSGMGFDTAKYLAEEGAKVYITGRNAKAISDAAFDIGHKVIAVPANQASIADSEKLAETIAANGDKLDGLYVNAGVAVFYPFEHTTEEAFDTVFNTNLKGAYFTIQKLLPVLKDGSSIVLNGSNTAHMGVASTSAYAATKAGLNSLAKTLSRDLLPRRIRVNVVNPGPIATPIVTKVGIPADMVDEVMKGFIAQVPVGRIGRPDEITGYVAFLLSDKSTFILGTELTIDGGFSQL